MYGKSSFLASPAKIKNRKHTIISLCCKNSKESESVILVVHPWPLPLYSPTKGDREALHLFLFYRLETLQKRRYQLVAWPPASPQKLSHRSPIRCQWPLASLIGLEVLFGEHVACQSYRETPPFFVRKLSTCGSITGLWTPHKTLASVCTH